MKTKCLFVMALAAGLVGCSSLYHSPVPGTRIKGEIAGVPFSIESPKQATMKGVELVIKNATNEFRLVIADYQSINDPQVIDKASAGRVAEMNATFNGLNAFAEKVANGLAQGASKALVP